MILFLLKELDNPQIIELEKFEFYCQVNIQDLEVDKFDFKCRL